MCTYTAVCGSVCMCTYTAVVSGIKSPQSGAVVGLAGLFNAVHLIVHTDSWWIGKSTIIMTVQFSSVQDGIYTLRKVHLTPH